METENPIFMPTDLKNIEERFDKFEQKFEERMDRLTDSMISLARAEERLIQIETDRTRMWAQLDSLKKEEDKYRDEFDAKLNIMREDYNSKIEDYKSKTDQTIAETVSSVKTYNKLLLLAFPVALGVIATWFGTGNTIIGN